MLNLKIVAPMFFADPAGAIVGRYCSRHFPQLNAKWIGEKTVMGSVAVFLVTYFTILYEAQVWQRLLIAFAAMVAEAVGGNS